MATEPPLLVLEQLFGAATAHGFAAAVGYWQGSDGLGKLTRAAEEASWWGDADRFAAWLERYEALIASVCNRWTGIDRDAAANDCRTDLWRTWSKVGSGTASRPVPMPLDESGPYARLVATYVRNACRGQWRGEAPSRLANLGDTSPTHPSGLAGAEEQLRRSQVAWTLELLLMAEIQTLPPGQRDVVLVRWSEMRDSGEILDSKTVARMLGKSTSAIDNAYSRACSALLERGVDLAAAEAACRRVRDAVEGERRMEA